MTDPDRTLADSTESVQQEQLRPHAASGVKWLSVSGLGTSILQVIQLAVLARFLTPADFGLMAMVLVVIGVTQAFGDVGLSNIVVQKKTIRREELATLYWVNLVAGILITLVVAASAPFVAMFYLEPRVAEILPIAALTFLFASPGQQFQMLLQRDLRFREIAVGELSAAFTGTIVAVALAMDGRGIYSLVIGYLASTALRSFVFLRVGWNDWRPRIHFSFEELKEHLRFGLHQMGERVVNFVSANVDYIVVGRYLGSEILGAYAIAYQLVVIPLTRINPILNRVAFPLFARKQDDDGALRLGYLEVTKFLSLIVGPLLVGLAIVAPVAVPVVLGDGWQLTTGLIPILAVVGMLKAVGNPSGSVFLAKGRADIGFYWNCFIAAVNSVAFLMFVRYGVFSLATSYAVLTTAYFLLGLVVLRSIIGLPPDEYFRSLKSATAGSTFMALVVYGCYKFFNPLLPEIALLVTLIGIGVLTYGTVILKLERSYIANLVKLLKKDT
jgi:O-antigen/teichoic acid export membrane protein